MKHVISASEVEKYAFKDTTVREFLENDWTDHVYLIPSDFRSRKSFIGVPVSITQEESVDVLQNKYIDNLAQYSVREKDFGRGVISYWLYLNVIVSPEEYEEAFKEYLF